MLSLVDKFTKGGSISFYMRWNIILHSVNMLAISSCMRGFRIILRSEDTLRRGCWIYLRSVDTFTRESYISLHSADRFTRAWYHLTLVDTLRRGRYITLRSVGTLRRGRYIISYSVGMFTMGWLCGLDISCKMMYPLCKCIHRKLDDRPSHARWYSTVCNIFLSINSSTWPSRFSSRIF